MKKTFHLLFVLTTVGCSVGAATIGHAAKVEKIVIEQKVKSHIVVKAAHNVRLSEVNSTDNVMSIRLNYEDYDDSMFHRLSTKEDNSANYKNVSKSYHSGKNRSIAARLGVDADDIFVSEYTPYVFYNFKNSDMSDVYARALKIEANSAIASIHLFPKNLYDLIPVDYQSLQPASISNVDLIDTNGSFPDLRNIPYDNFPNGTAVTGAGVKIGIFDTGIFDVNNANFDNNYVEIVRDTYSNAAETNHPTVMASIISGKYGAASLAQLYYVDANSDTSYTGLERLINKDVDVINMSLSTSSCYVNGDYDASLEGYVDYLYQSTHTLMIAAAGNMLNLEGTGGYVSLPGLCANVITVGSITSTGTPSDFSSYRMRNSVMSKPNLVATGSNRVITGFSGTYDGTSASTAAVTGAVALLIDKHGTMNMPKVVTMLQATVNRTKINTTPQTFRMRFLDVNDLDGDGITNEYLGGPNEVTVTNNFVAQTGFNERTGAGALDIAKLLNFNNAQLATTITIPSTSLINLKTNIYLYPGYVLTASIAWERSVTVDPAFWWWETTTYTSNTLANYDLVITNLTGTVVASTSCTSSNNEMVRYIPGINGYYSIKLQPRTNYSAPNGNYINFAYSVN